MFNALSIRFFIHFQCNFVHNLSIVSYCVLFRPFFLFPFFCMLPRNSIIFAHFYFYFLIFCHFCHCFMHINAVSVHSYPCFFPISHFFCPFLVQSFFPFITFTRLINQEFAELGKTTISGICIAIPSLTDGRSFFFSPPKANMKTRLKK